MLYLNARLPQWRFYEPARACESSDHSNFYRQWLHFTLAPWQLWPAKWKISAWGRGSVSYFLSGAKLVLLFRVLSGDRGWAMFLNPSFSFSWPLNIYWSIYLSPTYTNNPHTQSMHAPALHRLCTINTSHTRASVCEQVAWTLSSISLIPPSLYRINPRCPPPNNK